MSKIRKCNKTLVFVKSNRQLDSVICLLRKNAKKNILVIILDTNIQRRLIKENIPYVNIEDYRNPKLSYKEAAEETVELIKKWGKTKVNDTQELEQLLIYKGFSLWNIAELRLFWFLIYLIDKIRLINYIIMQEQPDEVILIEKKDTYEKIIYGVSSTMEIKVSVLFSQKIFDIGNYFKKFIYKTSLSFKGNNFLIWIPSFSRSFLKWLRITIICSLAKRVNFTYDSKKYIDNTKINKIIILIPGIYASSLIPVIRELAKDNKNEVLPVEFGFNSAKDRLIKENISYKSFEGYTTFKIRKKMRQKTKQFSKLWRQLENLERFRESLVYQNIPMWELIKDKFNEILKNTSPNIIKDLETTKKIIEIENPDIMVLFEECLPYARAFVESSKSQGILTLSISDRNISIINDFPEGGLIIHTDKISVGCKVAKENYIRRGNSADKIVITGIPKFDPLVNKDSIFKKERIYRKLGLELSKKLVILATSPVKEAQREEDKKKLLRATYEAMRKLPDVQFIVKLHPLEYGNMEKRIADSVGLNNLKIIKNSNLWELLYASDLVIVSGSTVGHEIIAMDKPLVQVNLSKSGSGMPYAKSGAAIGVYHENHMVQAIRRGLYDFKTKNDLKKGRQKYTCDYLYKIDGQASKRVTDLIYRMISGKRLQKDDHVE